MPTLTIARIGLPVCPFQVPPRICRQNAAIRPSTSCTSGTTSRPSQRIFSPRGARSATWSTARCSVELIFSPENIASIRCRRPQASASLRSSESVSSVIRCFE